MEHYLKTGLAYFRQYKIEAFLFFCSLITIITSLILFSLETNIQTNQETPVIEKRTSKKETENQFIYIDISGAVKKPNMYRLQKGSRFNDLLQTAGGLAQDADIRIFQQHFNRAKLLTDQEKYYIPSNNEEWSSNEQNEVENTVVMDQDLISLNTADEMELDSLPGVGAVTVGHIIQGRPYQSVDELLTKKIVKQNVFDQIKPLLSL